MVSSIVLSRDRFASAVLYLPHQKLAYLNNAKVACSTIKKSLWLWADPSSYRDNPHARPGPYATLSDMAADPAFGQATFFSVVRNPYVRVLSAYLDKVAKEQRDLAVWHPIARRFRLSGEARPSFLEFLQLIASEDPWLVDQHFAPQYVNILTGLVTPNYVGRMEEMQGVSAFLARHGVTIENHIPHGTKARHSIADFYGPKETKLAAEIYSRDFDLFGYSLDPMRQAPERPVLIPALSRKAVELFVQVHAGPPHLRRQHLDGLRTAASNLDYRFTGLEAGVFSLQEIIQMSTAAISGEISNWKLVSQIGQDLAKRDMIFDAASVFSRARILMHGA